MKKLLLFLGVIFFSVPVFAGQIVESHVFYDGYSPATTDIVYNIATAATWDVIATNTYGSKTIQINGITLNSDGIEVQIEASVYDIYNWGIVGKYQMDLASSDLEKNRLIEISPFVQYVRIGIRNRAVNALAQKVKVSGAFTNVSR
jgi:hypothetical protein